jgi:hypothetical protein
MLMDMVKQNTDLTEAIKALAERVESLTAEVHRRVVTA